VGAHTEAGAIAWKGLPFAAPPVGALRWRAPELPPAETGRHEAIDPGEPCMQFAVVDRDDGVRAGDAIGSEDCLRLDVHAPPSVLEGRSGLPVLVWIHGGGNSIGERTMYDGGPLAKRHDLLVVTVSYRLGVFGWARHPALFTAEDDREDRSGNFGTLDLVRALEWVRDHIDAFGGDPDRVTIFGESAGGTNVFSLLLSPRARGLFHGAIAQSGSTRFASLRQAEAFAEELGPEAAPSTAELLRSLLVASGEAPDREAAKRLLTEEPAGLAERLRALPAEDVLATQAGERFAGMYRGPWVIADGFVLPRGADASLLGRADGPADVPVIVGTNRDESRLFLLLDPSNPTVRRFRGIPLWFRDEERFLRDAEYPSLFWKLRGADRPASAIASLGRPVYAYRFDWDEEGRLFLADLSRMLGASHAIEIPFVFGWMDLGRFDRMLFDPDRKAAAITLSDAMMSYWAQFARTGDPARGVGGDLSEWRAWPSAAAAGGRFLVLDTPADGGIRMSGESLTREGLLERLVEDPRFESWEERCEVIEQLAPFEPDLLAELRARTGRDVCGGTTPVGAFEDMEGESADGRTAELG
jgi:para-nitrobenzyl esterase